MVMAGLWKRKDIDAMEASLYRKVLLLQNGISNRAILEYYDKYKACGRGYIPPSLSSKGGG